MNYCAQLYNDSPFNRVFGGGLVPVKQVAAPNVRTTRGTAVMVFVRAALCGGARDPEPCLWLDWIRCSAEQRTELSKVVCELRGGRPDEFLSYMDRGGEMPIRCSQVDGAPFPL